MKGTGQYRILILLEHEFEMWHPPAWFADRLRNEFQKVDIVQSPATSLSRWRRWSRSGGLDEKELSLADVMIGWSLSPNQLRNATRLRWIYSITAGVDHFLFPEFVDSDVVLCNAGRVHGSVVAEHAITMVLVLAKHIPSAVRYQERRKWAMKAIWNEYPRQREINGATMVLVGLGSIGAKIAAMANALKMRVIGIREHPERGKEGVHAVKGFESLDSAIMEADFVVLAVPETEKTRNLVDERRLQLFKSSAYLINVARGSLIDESALVSAIRSRKLAGAALDVFEQEPLPRRSPLWKMPQVLVTPHMAFLTDKAWERHYELFASNLRRYISGQPLLDVVNKRQGY